MSSWNRRELLKAAALGCGSVLASAQVGRAGSAVRVDSETLVAQLHSSLTAEQRRGISFAFDDPLRSRVENNWHITDARVGGSFSDDQQALIGEIFRGLHSEEFAARAFQRLREDSGGLESCSVALFGEPGSGDFEFVLTGRHVTMRCDGDSVDGAAFGGPIFYGHQGERFTEAADHPGNVYWYQALQANQVFQALDGKQRGAALVPRARRERGVGTVTLKRDGERGEGLPVAQMSADQRELVEATLSSLLMPFRERDRSECVELIRATGGVEQLSMAFYESGDTGDDGVWDLWQLESPTMIWHFRGAPHVHVWVNVQANPGWRPPAALAGRRRG